MSGLPLSVASCVNLMPTVGLQLWLQLPCPCVYSQTASLAYRPVHAVAHSVTQTARHTHPASHGVIPLKSTAAARFGWVGRLPS